MADRPYWRLFFGIVLILAFWVAVAYAFSPALPNPAGKTLRWAQGAPGCSLIRGKDGKYRYGLAAADLHISVVVDSQELQLIRRRVKPLFALGLVVHYSGRDVLPLAPTDARLEFANHSHTIRRALDPYALTVRLRTDSASLEDQTSEYIRKHPQNRQSKLKTLREYENDTADMVNFLNTNALHGVALRPGHPDADGWLFFDTDSRWIGNWKKKENFLLHLSLAGTEYEFPFALPPQEVSLRQRW